jgi:hypothetical protein
MLGGFVGEKELAKSDYPLLTKQGHTRHACCGIVSQATSRKQAEIAYGMTLHHPY